MLSSSEMTLSMTKHATISSVPIRSEHGDETETTVVINHLPTSIGTAVTTATLPISLECSIHLLLTVNLLKSLN